MADMDDSNYNPRVFAIASDGYAHERGLRLRDLFAGAFAMQMLKHMPLAGGVIIIPREAYALADAMLYERAKSHRGPPL